MGYWLFKSEPDEFSIDDLAGCGKKGECWEGIRNYQARNFLRDQVSKGDRVLFYHSSCKHVGVAGTGVVIKSAFPDPFQFDPESKYFDSKSDPDAPRWFAVQLQFEQKFTELIPLAAIKANPALSDFQLVKRGNRLSVFPVAGEHWDAIMAMAN